MVRTKRDPARAEGNQAPVVSEVVLEPAHPAPGDAIVARAVARDPDGDPVRLEYSWTVNGRPVDAQDELPGNLTARDVRIQLEVVASDGKLESEPYRVSARVEPNAPTIQTISFDPPEKVKPGDTVAALVDASAADDLRPQLRYEWMVNGDVVRGARERTFSTAGLRRGDKVQVRITASDGDVSSDPVLSAPLELVNSPPQIAGIPKAEKNGDAFRYQFEATDPDGDHSLRWSLGKAPAGMTIDPIYGIATWRPTKEQVGPQQIEVQVTDSSGDGSALSFQVEVTSTLVGPDGKPVPAQGAAGASGATGSSPAPAAPAKSS